MPMSPGSVRAVRMGELPFRSESRLTIPSLAAGLLLLGWAAISGVSLLLDASLSPRFLDLPLGAFLAGQGALLGIVIVGMRFTRVERSPE